MSANLAQNLDQMAIKMKSESPQPSKTQPAQQETKSNQRRPNSQELPPLNMPTAQPPNDASPGSSHYSLSSGVEAYLNSDYFAALDQTGPPAQPGISQRGEPPTIKAYNPPPTQTGPPIPKKEPYNVPPRPHSAAQQAKNDQYGTYQPTAQQQYGPGPLAPPVDRPRPQSQGRSQYPAPPPMVDYSKPSSYPPPGATGQQPYQQPYQTSSYDPDQSRYGAVPQAPSQTANSYASSAPYPQDSNIPEAPIPAFHNLSLNEALRPPSRPTSQAGRQSPRQSVLMGSQPSVVPPTESEWEIEINSLRENALNTNDPNIALTWAEKVYMYVSISLEELRREQALAGVGDAGVAARPSTPSYERGLRDDCARVVEKFVKAGNSKAVCLTS